MKKYANKQNKNIMTLLDYTSKLNAFNVIKYTKNGRKRIKLSL